MFKRRSLLFIALLLILSLLVGCNNSGIHGEGNIENENNLELVDMAGRKISLTARAEKIFSTEPVGTILLYSLSPDKMVGWNYELREGEKRYIPEEYHNLPNLGGAGREPVNAEEILKVDPDIIITTGKIDETLKSQAEEMERQLGKPVVLLDDDIHKLDEAYGILGKISGQEARAKELASYCQAALEEAKNNRDKINSDDKVNIYYAEGPNGLETEPANSWHAEVIDLVAGRNVAQVDEKGNKGKTEVSIEQLLVWDPEIIISWDDERGGYYSNIFTDPAWKDIKAVKDGEVYEIPNQPFNWFDRPPSVNRVLGIKWLGNLLYPELFDFNIEDEVKEFYSKFYHYQLSGEEVEELLKNSTRHRK